jgi:uncharacterized SAM-binding protein YcdF (DUF218 family)
MDTFFWILSKILWNLASPEKVVLILLFAGTVLIWSRRQKLGRGLVTLSALMFFVFTLLPVNVFLLKPLEERFSVPTMLPENIDGIIVLGGSENSVTTWARGQPSFDDGAERLTTFVALARRYPQARLIYAGGTGSMLNQDKKSNETARMLFEQLGLDIDRVLFDAKARNTFENAVNSFELLGGKTKGDWILITSAFHMPRSVGIFRKTGWSVIPYPVDFQTSGKWKYDWKFGRLYNFLEFSTGLHEWLGLIAYRVTGKTAVLFPKPVLDVNARGIPKKKQ